MFTVKERDDILKLLINRFSKKRRVEAVVLVGSMSENKEDKYSDIDLLVIVSNENLIRLWEETEKYFKTEFDIINLKKNKYSDINTNISVLLKNFLEIDIIFRTKESFIDKYSNSNFPYKIIYSKIDLNINPLKTEHLKNSHLLDNCIGNIWSKFKTSAIAIKRGKYLRASYEINRIREQLVEICTQLQSLCSVGYRDADLLDNNIKQMVLKTYPKSINYKGLKTSLKNCLNLLMQILQNNNKIEEAQSYNNLFDRFFKEINF